MRKHLTKIKDYSAFLADAWRAHIAPRRPDAETVISLFAGAGGSSLGYSMAGFRELLAAEWNENAIEVLRLNFPGVPIFAGDIKRLTNEQIFTDTGLAPGQLDVLDASPPCQGFSTAGSRELDDGRNDLYLEFSRLLRALKPKAFVMENVAGMVKGKMKLVFAEILRDLRSGGYFVSARMLNAMYFGVPQSRPRLIFVGIRKDIGIMPSHPDAFYRPITLREAVIDLGENEMPPPMTRFILPYLSKMKPGMSAKDAGCSGGDQTARVRWDRPVPTISKGLGSIGTGMHIHPTEPRVLSIAELKRCSSFPDEFRFLGDYKMRLARIGNSVPPLFMRAIAAHLSAAIAPERIQ